MPGPLIFCSESQANRASSTAPAPAREKAHGHCQEEYGTMPMPRFSSVGRCEDTTLGVCISNVARDVRTCTAHKIDPTTDIVTPRANFLAFSFEARYCRCSTPSPCGCYATPAKKTFAQDRVLYWLKRSAARQAAATYSSGLAFLALAQKIKVSDVPGSVIYQCKILLYVWVLQYMDFAFRLVTVPRRSAWVHPVHILRRLSFGVSGLDMFWIRVGTCLRCVPIPGFSHRLELRILFFGLGGRRCSFWCEKAWLFPCKSQSRFGAMRWSPSLRRVAIFGLPRA